MYTLERMKKWKIIWGIAAAVFFCLSLEGLVGGGHEIVEYGFMNEPLPSIVMIAAFFAGIISVLMCLTIHGLQKDISEQLKFLKNK